MSQETPKLTTFPRPHPFQRSILKEWGFSILELETDHSEVVQVILPEGWRKDFGYMYKFDLLDDQGNIRGDGQCSSNSGYFRINPKYLPECIPEKPTFLEQCLSFIKGRSPDA